MDGIISNILVGKTIVEVREYFGDGSRLEVFDTTPARNEVFCLYRDGTYDAGTDVDFSERILKGLCSVGYLPKQESLAAIILRRAVA